MKLKLMYVLSRKQRELIRLDSIEAGTKAAANYRSLAAGYLKVGRFDLAQQMTEYAKHFEMSVQLLQEEVIK